MNPSVSNKPSINPRQVVNDGGAAALAELLARTGYMVQEGVLNDLVQAIKKGAPHLIEGERGSGKTALAEALAEACNLPIFYLQGMQGLELDDVLYSWDREGQSQFVRQANSPGSHNLETAAKTYLDITLDKSLQTSDWSEELSQAQLAYAAKDSRILLPHRRSLIERLAQDQLFRVARLEFEAVPAFASIELAGLYLDQTLWAKQLQLVSSKHAILASELQQLISAGARQTTLFGESNINLGSHPQVATALREMGVPIDKATRNTDLVPLQDQYPVVAKLLEYRTVDKALTSYGQNWLDAVNKNTSRILAASTSHLLSLAPGH